MADSEVPLLEHDFEIVRTKYEYYTRHEEPRDVWFKNLTFEAAGSTTQENGEIIDEKVIFMTISKKAYHKSAEY